MSELRARGIDVSVWQASLPALGSLDFVIARASIGAGYDARYAAHARNVKHAGLVLGAYHFAVYGPGPTRQARTLLAHAPTADFLVVDDEATALAHPQTVRGIIANLHALDPQRRMVGLYSSDGTWPGDLGQDFAWVANWAREPIRPWRFWQSDNGHGRLDHDRYNGTPAQLKAWARTRRRNGT